MKSLLLLFLAIAASASISATDLRFSSGPRRASLIELFTSEGCSSCPPADEWLGKLRDDPGLWRDVVPVAFHVTYWDNLGWLDRLASPPFTRRQYAYADAWGSSSVYTPCFVRDGAEWHPGDGWRSASQAHPGVLSVTVRSDSKCRIEFKPSNGTARTGLDAHLALLGGGLSSRVSAGENRGRTLPHEFVALALVDVPLSPAGGAAVGELSLPKPAIAAPRKAIAVWVTRSGSLAPIQATGTWLEQE